MKKVHIKITHTLSFYCPGCGHKHYIPINGNDTWTMTGTEECPTIEPSILNYIPKEVARDGKLAIEKTQVCHLHIKVGKIEFCSDSQHQLAGQTIDMKELE